MTWMIYGANGYTGRLVARLARERGEEPLLAGRSAGHVAELGEELGLRHVSFGLDDTRAVRDALSQVKVVAHCAGPFAATAGPMLEGCLASGTHYLDVTGEIDVFEAVFGLDQAARRVGVVLLPGAGFDVVPTDCLAASVADQLPDAVELDIAFRAGGGFSPGTVKTALAGAGGRARVDGAIRSVPLGWRTREVPFPSGTREVVSVPWGDVATAYRSTGIPNITTYTRVRGSRGAFLLKVPGLGRLGRRAAGRLVRGPDDATRAASSCEVWVEARNAAGGAVSATLTGPNAYDLTADAVVRAARRLVDGGVPPGSHTPSSAFGWAFVTELDGVAVQR